MKKVFTTVIGLVVIVAIGGYLLVGSVQDQLWPSQASVLKVSDDNCKLSALPKLPNVTLISATVQDEQADHCNIVGVIDTEINFELRLPNEWNGKFVMGGGGGFAGILMNVAMNYGAIRSGYATVGTDTGHSAHPLDGRWALNNPERLENFGYRAVHLTATTAKSLIAAYYKQPSSKNYFIGCSRGGGQALMEAQRYPEDFDGIVAGAPAYNWSALTANGIQINQKMFPDPDYLDEAVIGHDQQSLIAQSYLQQCDQLDGIIDGILSDPRHCQFDLESLRCKGPGSSVCLSDKHIEAMKVVYEGPRDDEGPLYPGFPLGGETSEAGMSLWVTGGLKYNSEFFVARDSSGLSAPVMPNALFGFSTGIMKYMILNDADWDYSEYSFENFRQQSAFAASILNATNPDLSAFRNNGGKLLMYHGWSDMALSALGTIAYFEQVIVTDPTANDDVRLYMMPGVDHCFGGAGPSLVNYLTEIDKWVVSGEQPEELAAQWLQWNFMPLGSRLICPYPQQAQYDGAGDTRDQSSFSCVVPAL